MQQSNKSYVNQTTYQVAISITSAEALSKWRALRDALAQCNTWLFCDKSEGCGACDTASLMASTVVTDTTRFGPNSKYWCNDAKKFPWFAPSLGAAGILAHYVKGRG